MNQSQEKMQEFIRRHAPPSVVKDADLLSQWAGVIGDKVTRPKYKTPAEAVVLSTDIASSTGLVTEATRLNLVANRIRLFTPKHRRRSASGSALLPVRCNSL